MNTEICHTVALVHTKSERRPKSIKITFYNLTTIKKTQYRCVMMLFVRSSFFDTAFSVFLLYVAREQHDDKSLSKTNRKVIVLYDFKRRQFNLIIILPGQSNRIEFISNIIAWKYYFNTVFQRHITQTLYRVARK